MRSNVRTPEPTDDEITVDAAAERARLTPSRIGELARRGQIVARRAGNRVFINVASLRDYIRRIR